MRRVLAAVCLAAVLVSCGPPGGTSIQSGPGASGAASDGSLAPLACPITQPPGPDDVPPITGETDTSAQGGGRAAVCLVGPAPVDWESTAWCTWTPDRIAVEAVTGLPTTPAGADGERWDVFLDLRRSVVQVSLTTAEGTVTTWEQPAVDARIADDGSDGLSAFDAPLAADQAPPPGTPPRVAGVLRWQCADPPP